MGIVEELFITSRRKIMVKNSISQAYFALYDLRKCMTTFLPLSFLPSIISTDHLSFDLKHHSNCGLAYMYAATNSWPVGKAVQLDPSDRKK